jgi:hypothetical protein
MHMGVHLYVVLLHAGGYLVGYRRFGTIEMPTADVIGSPAQLQYEVRRQRRPARAEATLGPPGLGKLLADWYEILSHQRYEIVPFLYWRQGVMR